MPLIQAAGGEAKALSSVEVRSYQDWEGPLLRPQVSVSEAWGQVNSARQERCDRKQHPQQVQRWGLNFFVVWPMCRPLEKEKTNKNKAHVVDRGRWHTPFSSPTHKGVGDLENASMHS